LQHRLLFFKFQQNYFDDPVRLFSDLYPAKSFFPCNRSENGGIYLWIWDTSSRKIVYIMYIYLDDVYVIRSIVSHLFIITFLLDTIVSRNFLSKLYVWAPYTSNK